MWSNDVVLLLIELYKSYEFLWDTSNNDYKNKIKKDRTWEEIANILKLPRRDVESKMHNLRSQYAREKKKGTPSKRCHWFAYEALRFLEKGETNEEMDITREQSTSQDSQSTRNTEDFSVDREEETADTKLNASLRNSMIEDRLNEAVEVMIKNKIKRVQTAIREKDDLDIYGQYIASELRKIRTDHGLVMTKYYINNIIMEARTGKYDKNDHQSGYNRVLSTQSRPEASSSRMSHYDDQNPLSPSSDGINGNDEDIKPCILPGRDVLIHVSPMTSDEAKRRRHHM